MQSSVRRRIEPILAAVLIAAGVVLLALPKQWIEGKGGGGDGGDGGFELIVALVPLVLGVALVAHVLVARGIRARGARSRPLP